MKFQITTPQDKEAVKAYIDKLVYGKRFDISIVLHRQKRSLDQNRLLFLWINCISAETGQDKDDLHRFFKLKFIGVQWKYVFEQQVPIEPTTTTLDTKQFTDYLERIQSFAASELGIALPNPEDAIWAQFYEQYRNYV